MNCPSRTDELPRSDGLNQSPPELSNDLTTNEDLNGVANGRRLRRSVSPPDLQAGSLAGGTNRGGIGVDNPDDNGCQQKTAVTEPTTTRVDSVASARRPSQTSATPNNGRNSDSDSGNGGGALESGGQDGGAKRNGPVWKAFSAIRTVFRFIGPGFIVSVAYSKCSFSRPIMFHPN